MFTILFFCASLHFREGDAFRTATTNQYQGRMMPRTTTRLQEREVGGCSRPSDLDTRRDFLKNSAAASSILLALITTTTPKDVASAAEEEPDDIITTPSISEGELALSQPPPNREVPVIVTTPSSSSSSKEGGKKKAADPRFFVAGAAAAAISHGITTPLDVVKTRMQSESALANISPSEAALKIIEDEGPEALAVGLGPTVVGYGIEGAVKFGAYESLKPVFLSTFAGGGSGSQAFLTSAVCAGALASIILCPMEETRIRLVTDPTFGKGLVDGLPKLLREEGVLSPFKRGMAPMLAKQIPYTIGKQVSFDVFAGMLYTVLAGLAFVPQKGIALEVEIGAAFLASIVACLLSHPGDVLLTATYKDREGSSNGGFGATVKGVYEEGGASAFFRGLNARFLHVACIITFQLVIYDQLKLALGLPASGS